MRRQVLVFVVVVVVVFGAGYLAYRYLLQGPEGDDPRPTPPPQPVHPRADSPDAAQPEPEKEPARVTVVSTRGKVERRGSRESDWQPLAPGDELGIDEAVKTSRNAGAKLRVDENSEIDLADRSELSVREINDTVHRFKLMRGKIRVDYDEAGERVLRVESDRSDAVAETRAGAFTVQNTAGIVSVATTKGEVKLTARNKSVAVAAGQATRVLPGAAPEPAAPIPVSIMLRVAAPGKLRQREAFTFVHGETSAGARVFVNGIAARVNRRGRFRMRVPLQEGENRITVVAEDVAGNRRSHALPIIIVDPTAPVDRMDIRWGRKDKRG